LKAGISLRATGPCAYLVACRPSSAAAVCFHIPDVADCFQTQEGTAVSVASEEVACQFESFRK